MLVENEDTAHLAQAPQCALIHPSSGIYPSRDRLRCHTRSFLIHDSVRNDTSTHSGRGPRCSIPATSVRYGAHNDNLDQRGAGSQDACARCAAGFLSIYRVQPGELPIGHVRGPRQPVFGPNAGRGDSPAAATPATMAAPRESTSGATRAARQATRARSHSRHPAARPYTSLRRGLVWQSGTTCHPVTKPQAV